jgi:putative nucleotidyltransferase with HDIG domain
VDAATRLDLYYAALIHDLGVSSTEVHRHLLSELEWPSTQAHCELAADLLRRFRPLAHLAELLRHHHTHWECLSTTGLSPRDQQLANLIFLCDRVDAVRAQGIAAGNAGPGAGARAVIAQRRGTFFDPHLVDCFLEASAAPAFWDALTPPGLETYFASHMPPDPSHTIGMEDIRDLGRLFAHVVDAKSPFTARHSQGVAQLSCHLARRLGLPADQVNLIATAALLHDLGKLRVPDTILDKPGPLDPKEEMVMRRHAYDSYELLDRIDGFGEVAQWAGLHHETPKGDGYPERLRGTELPLQSRIISVADVFQALAQDRPYRPGLSSHEILAVLRREADANHQDPGLVALVAEDLEQCWQAAVGENDPCTADN